MMAETLLVFDLDGTLIDSRADLRTGINRVRADYGFPPLDLDTVTSTVGNGVRKLVQRALPNRDVDLTEAVDKMRQYYLENLTVKTRLYDGVFDVLQDLSSREFRLALVTNKPEHPTRLICEHFGIDAFFDAVIGGDTCENLKPDAEPLLLAAQRTGCRTDGAWMVGDNVTDLAAGRNAGFKRCYCAYGFGRRDGEEADLCVNSLAEFADYLLGGS